MKLRAYIDGFNLYNGAIKKTPYKWLDLVALCEALRPNDVVDHVTYCTAQIEARENNPDGPRRQRLYWRALLAKGRVDIVEGQFKSQPHRLPTKASLDAIAAARKNGNTTPMKPTFVEVVRPEEKGTDVNLAVHLIHDAHRGLFEGALVITNDSDIATAIKLVCQDLNLPVWVCNPRPTRTCVELRNACQGRNFDLRRTLLAQCQLPQVLTDARGTVTKPADW